jgi:spore germination protein YaaH
MNKKVVIGVGMVAVLVTVVVTGWMLVKNKKIELLNPVGVVRDLVVKENKIRVMGFLPTWMVGKTIEYCKEIDTLIFLGIETNKMGDLIWDLQSEKINSEAYRVQKERIKQCGGKNVVGIKLFKDAELAKLIGDEEGRQRLIAQVKTVIEVGGFDGVNVDFEYQGNPVAVLESDFIQLLTEMRAAGLGELSLDVFANTVIKGDEEKLKALMKEIDYLIVMAYDFHGSGSSYAGPVAPMRSETGERNIMEVTERINGFNLDKNKIVMAYPLYGYEWRTVTTDWGSEVKSYVQMWSYSRAEDAAAAKSFGEVKWDEVSSSPWMSYIKGETVTYKEKVRVGKVWKTVTKTKIVDVPREIYYENDRSLGVKLDLVEQLRLGGVGFWALGYEGEKTAVWERVKRMNDIR